MSQSKFAVFDIDGTLIRWQLYHAVVDHMAGHGLIDPKVYKNVRTGRMAWKNRTHPESFKDYEQLIISAYESALPHMTTEQFNAVVTEVAAEYKEQTYRYTRELARKLKDRGYMLLAISGSHQELVEHICRQYGFDDCVGTRYEQQNGRFTGKSVIGSHRKQTVLKDLIAKHNLTLQGSYAVGDSLSDAVMLEVVENPIAFNPDRQLFDTATSNNWKIVIERKNVIYELQATNGRYQLQ